MLVRDGGSGPEVYVQRRVASMAFAPSTVVFPGGGVDLADHALAVSTPGLAELASVMGVDAVAAAPFAAAAVREVEEECGVRLSVADLRGRAHWVTPEFEPRRYDTWILAAGMPAGQEAIGTTTESDHSAWVRPSDLLDRHTAGEVRMLPPTVVSLEQLAEFGSAAAFLADRPVVAKVVPVLVVGADGEPVLRTEMP
jgi:8-oxo-dGTP pyrophosphatase MutT (NUDIX family)